MAFLMLFYRWSTIIYIFLIYQWIDDFIIFEEFAAKSPDKWGPFWVIFGSQFRKKIDINFYTNIQDMDLFIELYIL